MLAIFSVAGTGTGTGTRTGTGTGSSIAIAIVIVIAIGKTIAPRILAVVSGICMWLLLHFPIFYRGIVPKVALGAIRVLVFGCILLNELLPRR